MPEASDIVDILEADGLVTAGTDAFDHPEMVPSEHVPVDAVFVFKSGGLPPQPYIGVGKGFRQEFIEIRVRASESDFATGQALAQNIFDALHLRKVAGAVWLRAISGAPEYTRENKDDHPIWVMRFNLGHEKDNAD